jgi:hypothetical protein
MFKFRTKKYKKIDIKKKNEKKKKHLWAGLYGRSQGAAWRFRAAEGGGQDLPANSPSEQSTPKLTNILCHRVGSTARTRH